MSWFVYIAKAKTGRYYTGITTDPDKRIIKHNSGKGSRFAIEQGPFELVYISKTFPDKSEARKREIKINKRSVEVKLKNPLGIRTHDYIATSVFFILQVQTNNIPFPIIPIKVLH